MNNFDVNKCKYYKSNGKCKIPHYQQGIKFTSCNCSEWDCYYKQLQKSQNTIIVGLQIQTMLLANNSKLNKCLDEIKEICKANSINTCWTALNLCDKCKEKEECGLQSPLVKLDAISNIIKQAKEGE